jgi:2-haloacid dehalogenase
MTASRKAIIFDLGNVLVKWDLHPIFDRFFPNPEAVDAFLAEVSFLEWNALQDQGRPFREGITVISEQFPHYAHIFQYFSDHWEETIHETVEENVALASRLKRGGFPLYILSNFAAETFVITRARHSFLNMFDDIIISSEVGLIKPDPAIFQYTLDRIHRSAQDCIFIDDSLPNIEAALQLGFTALHFQSPGQLERQLINLQVI